MPTTHALAAACSLAVSVACIAQTETQTETPTETRPPVGENPLLTDRSADQLLRERLSRPVGGSIIAPVEHPLLQQVEPGQPVATETLDLADGSNAWTEAGTLRPEGTFLVGWTGEVARLRTGGLAFLPVSEAGRSPEPAMSLVPCGVYGRIGNLLGEEERGLWLAVTGEVLEYRGRNYLLPTAFTATGEPEPLGEPAQDEATPPPEADTPPEPGDADQPAGEPTPPLNRIDELVERLEAERNERRGIDTAFGDQAEQGSVDPEAMRLDGRMLLSQRARMIRSVEGGWVIVIDNDGAESELPARVRLLPCSVVAQMEKVAESKGEAWSFEVSGRLYRHGAAVYLLPRLFVTMAGGDVRPLQ